MVARPYWHGQIRMSLVSLPVNLYPALKSSRRVPMHEIYRPTGERVRHQKMAGDEPVNKEDIVKGYEYEKGEYVLIEPEEIQELRIPSQKTLDVVQFVAADAVDEIYFENPYYIVPEDDKAEDAFVVIREAMRETGKMGIGQLAIGGRERLCAIRPCGSGMLLETLHYKEEIRASDPYFESIDKAKIDKEQLDLAKELIKRKTAPFKPEKFHDHYHEALKELIDAKLHHRRPKPVAEERASGKVINLMDALRKSVESEGGAAKKSTRGTKHSKKPAAKKTTGRKIATRRKAS